MDPPPPLSLSKVETVHEINLGPALSPFCVCFYVEEDKRRHITEKRRYMAGGTTSNKAAQRDLFNAETDDLGQGVGERAQK